MFSWSQIRILAFFSKLAPMPHELWKPVMCDSKTPIRYQRLFRDEFAALAQRFSAEYQKMLSLEETFLIFLHTFDDQALRCKIRLRSLVFYYFVSTAVKAAPGWYRYSRAWWKRRRRWIRRFRKRCQRWKRRLKFSRKSRKQRIRDYRILLKLLFGS